MLLSARIDFNSKPNSPSVSAREPRCFGPSATANVICVKHCWLPALILTQKTAGRSLQRRHAVYVFTFYSEKTRL
jgi:hypothetical protein